MIASLLFVTAGFSQSNSKFWSEHEASVLELETAVNANVFPEKRRVINIDLQSLKTELTTQAPKEFTSGKGYVVNLPFPDGRNVAFEVFYSTIMEQGLQDKYPDIRSYKGYALENSDWVTRMTMSPLGLTASIFTDQGEIYIDPFVAGKTTIHASYFVKDYPHEVLHMEGFECGSHDDGEDLLAGVDFDRVPGGVQLRGAGESVSIKTFRLAVAASGDWTTRQGGRDAAIAKIAASTDRLNQIYERDGGVRMLLIAGNDQIVFVDGDADPYPGPPTSKAGRDILGLNTNVLNNNIGAGNYDIGHVFLNRCSDVGGVASRGSLCRNDKGNAVTCWANSSIEYTVVRVWAHEVGHQFSCQHTMNLCDRENESLNTGFEPGSGSTIMSYGGLCGSNNVVSGQAAANDITYFHANSIRNIFDYSRSRSNCGGEIATSNTHPDVDMDYENGFTIPVRTPFHLESTASDMEGDNLTYCFEQHDAANFNCTLGQPMGACPSFRSYPPNADDYRVFPRYAAVWNNQTFNNKNEVLVDYTRQYTFTVTVRDNNNEIGGFAQDTMFFLTDENSGPFLITSNNNAEDVVTGDIIELTWDVANTNVAPVNCRSVDIFVCNSSDWNDITPLLMGTENDGSEWIRVPAAQQNVRFLIHASESIWFDINNRNFDIVDAAAPGYSWGLSPNSGRICLPAVFKTEVYAAEFGGYDGNLALEVTNGLPNGATYSFGETMIETDGSTELEIDLSGVSGRQNIEIEVRGISDANDTLYRTIQLEIVGNDYSDLNLTTPVNSVQGLGQLPTFEWSSVADADLYNFQLATSPSFDAGSIVQENFDVGATSIAAASLLEKNTIYYWRVQGTNICGAGPWTVPSVFSTESATCKDYLSQDVEVVIPTGETTEYNITIDADAAINDVNVNVFDIFCNALNDATVSLISPKGTEVLLARAECGNNTRFDCVLDDQAANNRIRCPPINKSEFQPRGSLADFNTENAKGTWMLRTVIENGASQARLNRWGLQICVNQSLDAPYLVNNDTMKLKPGENSKIRIEHLLTRDDNNTAGELEYTIVYPTQFGDIQLNGSNLSQGSTFTQEDLNNGRVTYNQTAGVDAMDNFIFTVNDGSGGWTGAHTFEINADEDFPSATNDLEFEQIFTIYPNPTSGQTSLVFFESPTEEVIVEIHNLQGQSLKQIRVQPGTTKLDLELGQYQDGVYLVKTQIDQTYFVERITLTK